MVGRGPGESVPGLALTARRSRGHGNAPDYDHDHGHGHAYAYAYAGGHTRPSTLVVRPELPRFEVGDDREVVAGDPR